MVRPSTAHFRSQKKLTGRSRSGVRSDAHAGPARAAAAGMVAPPLRRTRRRAEVAGGAAPIAGAGGVRPWPGGDRQERAPLRAEAPQAEERHLARRAPARAVARGVGGGAGARPRPPTRTPVARSPVLRARAAAPLHRSLRATAAAR